MYTSSYDAQFVHSFRARLILEVLRYSLSAPKAS